MDIYNYYTPHKETIHLQNIYIVLTNFISPDKRLRLLVILTINHASVLGYLVRRNIYLFPHVFLMYIQIYSFRNCLLMRKRGFIVYLWNAIDTLQQKPNLENIRNTRCLCKLQTFTFWITGKSGSVSISSTDILQNRDDKSSSSLLVF